MNKRAYDPADHQAVFLSPADESMQSLFVIWLSRSYDNMIFSSCAQAGARRLGPWVADTTSFEVIDMSASLSRTNLTN
jgi:hypothetical protein